MVLPILANCLISETIMVADLLPQLHLNRTQLTPGSFDEALDLASREARVYLLEVFVLLARMKNVCRQGPFYLQVYIVLLVMLLALYLHVQVLYKLKQFLAHLAALLLETCLILSCLVLSRAGFYNGVANLWGFGFINR